MLWFSRGKDYQRSNFGWELEVDSMCTSSSIARKPLDDNMRFPDTPVLLLLAPCFFLFFVLVAGCLVWIACIINIIAAMVNLILVVVTVIFLISFSFTWSVRWTVGKVLPRGQQNVGCCQTSSSVFLWKHACFIMFQSVGLLHLASRPLRTCDWVLVPRCSWFCYLGPSPPAHWKALSHNFCTLEVAKDVH